MKRIALLVLLALCAASCYKDLSTKAGESIPDIIIRSDQPDTINIAYGSTLKINAEVSKEGSSAEDFSYNWLLDLKPGDGRERIELGDTPSVEYVVLNAPGAHPYFLTLEVVDRKSGTGRVKVWAVFVSSSLGEGLLVAHTRDNGQSSEFDLICDKAVTFGYQGSSEKIVRNLYETVNGEKFNGKVQVICNRASKNLSSNAYESRILIGTKEHLISLDPATYKFEMMDADHFLLCEETQFDVTNIVNFAGYLNYITINGRLYYCFCHTDGHYVKVACNMPNDNFFTRENTAYGIQDQGAASAFDPNSHKFYAIKGWSSMNSGITQINPTTSFDLSGSELLACGAGKGDARVNRYLMKDGSGAFHLLSFDPFVLESTYQEWDITPIDIENAVSFAFCDNADIFYYATPSTIYSTIVSSGVASTFALNWAPDDNNEKITMIRQYLQAWYGTQQISDGDYPFTLDTHHKQLMITTYNETTGEGKVYLRPYNISTGKFTFKSNGTYGGFGQILDITPTLR